MKCSICNEDFEGFGNNAEPVNDGRCCDFCNMAVVIPTRIDDVELEADSRGVTIETVLSDRGNN